MRKKRNLVGGNSGYVGYSMSKRAAQAYDDGKLTYSKLPIWAKRMIDAGLVETDEWHHTSSYGNETPFYNIKQFLPEDKLKELRIVDADGDIIEGKTFKDVPKRIIKEIDIQSKEVLKKKNNIKEVRKGIVDNAQKELFDFNSKFKRFSRELKPPEHSVVERTEMNGRYGWFTSHPYRYNLPEYHSGINYETFENRQRAIELNQQLSNARNNHIYEIVLKKIGFNENEIMQLKNLGIIDAEIMPDSFYKPIERNKDVIKIQLKEMFGLPKPNSEFSPHFSKSVDSFLTDKEKQERQDRHYYISEQGEYFGSSYKRRLAHEDNDLLYSQIAKDRYNKAKEEFLNSEEVKEQEIKFNQDKEKAQSITDDIKQLLGIDKENITPLSKAGGAEKKSAGDLLPLKNNSQTMNNFTYAQLPKISKLESGKTIVVREEVFGGNCNCPEHIGSRFCIAEIMGRGGMLNSVKLKVKESIGANPLYSNTIITRPISNVMKRGREFVNRISDSIADAFKKGGELDPDNNEVKEYFAHQSGDAGGVLLGKRHSEGGIKAVNNGTGDILEMEGGEVIITRNAVSDQTLREFEGKKMTNREILSAINQSGGGVAFSDGGSVKKESNCECN